MPKTVYVSDWLGVFIAGLAFALSGATWFMQYRRQVQTELRADVTVSFHWLTNMAQVELPGREPLSAGYHLVLANRGPAAAHSLSVELKDSRGRELTLLDVEPSELPLRVLDANGRYPIPFLYEPFTRHARRFEAKLNWTDGNGDHESVVPLRRGQLPG